MKKEFILMVSFSILMLALFPQAKASTDLGFRLGYLKFGEVKEKDIEEFNESDTDGVVLGVHLERSFMKLFAFNFEVDWYQKDKKVSDLKAGDRKFQTDFIPITANFKVKLPFPLLTPYAGVGAGLYYVDWKFDLKTDTGAKSELSRIKDSDKFWGTGFQGMIGVELSFVALGVFAEYQYRTFEIKLGFNDKKYNVKDTVEIHQAVVGVFLRI